MNRRRFLRSILGTAATSAIAPSLVWLFRKIFLPSTECWAGTSIVRPSLDETALQAVELETFTKGLPNLIYRESLLHTRLSQKYSIHFMTRNGFLTAPSPLLASIPIGPPNTIARVLDFKD